MNKDYYYYYYNIITAHMLGLFEDMLSSEKILKKMCNFMRCGVYFNQIPSYNSYYK